MRTDRKPRKRLDPDTRRSAILEAGAGLFATRSYPDVTISEVAAAAEGSAALVYRYFGPEDSEKRWPLWEWEFLLVTRCAQQRWSISTTSCPILRPGLFHCATRAGNPPQQPISELVPGAATCRNCGDC